MIVRATKAIFHRQRVGGKELLTFVPCGMLGEVVGLKVATSSMSNNVEPQVEVSWSQVYQSGIDGKNPRARLRNGPISDYDPPDVDLVDPGDIAYFQEDQFS